MRSLMAQEFVFVLVPRLAVYAILPGNPVTAVATVIDPVIEAGCAPVIRATIIDFLVVVLAFLAFLMTLAVLVAATLIILPSLAPLKIVPMIPRLVKTHSSR